MFKTQVTVKFGNGQERSVTLISHCVTLGNVGPKTVTVGNVGPKTVTRWNGAKS